MDDRKKDQSIQSHANFDGDSATGDRTQIRQDQQNQQPPQIDPSLADAQAVAASLGVDPNTGLSQAEAERRLAQYGPNELASAPPVPKWKKFPAQFKDPLVYLLLAATGISLIAWFIEKSQRCAGRGRRRNTAVRRHRHCAYPYRQRGTRLHSGIESGRSRRSALPNDRAANQRAARRQNRTHQHRRRGAGRHGRAR